VPRWCLQSLRLLTLFAAFASSLALAQSQSASRITQPIDDSRRVTLKGNVHPLSRPSYDQGAVPDSFPAERMFLILQRSPEREAALRQLIQDAHTPGSPSFHTWLTPEQFGELYGPEDSEVAAVAGWLQTHGFSVARVTKGKTAIEFSGSAGQLREAFHTEIHTYLINGETHHANNSDPQIPAALAPVITGITPMNDFRPKSNLTVLGRASYNPTTHEVSPQWTTDSGALALAPGDFAVQYDLKPLYAAGIDGTGVTIGIIGASDVDPTVVANYHSLFGLPASNLNVVIDGSDPTPGEGNWATGESYLDVEVSGAVATGATINLYTAADTSVQSGLLLAAQRAIDDDQASVLSTSYGDCEQDLGSSGNQFWAGLWEQAAAQGQTSFVSSGDGGAAGCDDFGNAQPAQYGLAVSGLSSTPWNISVGGTDFFYSTYNSTSNLQNAQLSTYWNLTSTDLPATSLLQPIPEQPWNRAFGLNLSTGGIYSGNSPTIVSGSGGASSCTSGVDALDGTFASCTGGYAKPSWQSGKGVPSDSVRDLPDVSLFAAAGENDSFYPVCEGLDQCVLFPNEGYFISAVGGTSASTPEMAGIMALINQKFGRQGQANFILYPLAAQHPEVFHDVAIGSNNVPCGQGTPNCTVSTLSDNTNGVLTLGHYYANAGYDEASGLGSVDANLLLKYWNSLTFTPTSTTLTLSQTTFTHGTPVQVSVAVTGSGGTPSGDIGFATTASLTSNTGMSELTLQGGAASATVDNLPGGQYQLTAKYTGDTIFAPSNSNPVTLDVTPEASTVSVFGNTWNTISNNSFIPIVNGASYPYGAYIAIDAQPRGVNAPQGSADGNATGTIAFSDSAGGGSVNSGAVNLNSQGIAEWVPAVTFPVGTNSFSASYSGDSSFNASSSSAPLTFTVTKAVPFNFVDAKPPVIALGSATTLALEVGSPYSGPQPAPPYSTFRVSTVVSPTGTATFYDGSNVLGTAPIESNGLWVGTATITVTSLPLGTDAITASYSGDANYDAVTSSAFNVTVGQPTTLSASANPSSINEAEFTAFTATVTGVKGMAVPTGTMTFSTIPPGYYWSDIATLNNGSATSSPLSGGYFSAGTVTINVSYSGDSIYGPVSVNVPFTVTQGNLPPFTLNATSVSIASPGAITGNASSITVTPENGFTGAVYFSCALTAYPIRAQDLPTCSMPPSVNVSGATAATAEMAVNSTAASSSAIVSPSQNWHFPNGEGRLAADGGVILAVLLSIWILAQLRGQRRLASLLFVLAILASLVGCGVHGGGEAITNPITDPGTTPGTYAFTVNGSFTANGVSQVQTTVAVTIQ
jgi:trimeric autotransporter adhesin